MGKVREAVTGIRRSLGQQEGDVSRLKEVLEALEGKHEQLQGRVTRQCDELAETRRRNEELGGRVQQLEEENHRLRDSSEWLKGQLARVPAGQQCEVARPREAIATGGSKVKEDLGTIQRDVAKLKEDTIVTMRITGNAFMPSIKKGKLRLRSCKETDEMYDIPDGIIAHLTKECGGNVYDVHIVNVTPASFEKETQIVSTIATNAADLKSGSVFLSAYHSYQEDIRHTRNNWVCEADWLELDHREKDDLLKVKNVTGTFSVSGPAYVYEIRLWQTGRSHGGKDYVVMSLFKIFGSVVPTMPWRELAKGHEFLTKVTPVGRCRPSVNKMKKFEVECDVPDGIVADHSRMTEGSGSKSSRSMRFFLRHLAAHH
jgi:hypothetical protein